MKPFAAPAILLALTIGAFLIANRAAYQSFFTGDDLDNMANAHEASSADYAKGFFKPAVGRVSGFRPVAHFFYFAAIRTAGTRFARYIGAIQLIHVLNVILMFLLARALGAPPAGAFAAALFFAFHAGTLAIYWRPMYVFDLLCATFCLLTLLTYIQGRLLLSLIFFWFALKSKEVAILLPLALAAYEVIFEKRRWKRLAPFFAISAMLGIQALIANTHREDDYALQFTPGAVWSCLQFYASKLVLAPYWIGLAAIAMLLFVLNRRVQFGALTFVSLLLLMLVLPGRLFGAYLYVPLIGLAIAMSAMSQPVLIAAFFAFWLPWNYLQLRIDRKSELAAAEERRAWFEPVAALMREHPEIDTFLYDHAPESLAPYGVAGAIRIFRPPDSPTTVIEADSPDRLAACAKPHLALIVWDAPVRVAHVLARGPDLPYVRLNELAPIWQLGEGWIDTANSSRWIAPHASARLYRPANARTFEVVVYVPEVYINRLRQGRLTVSINHTPVGSAVMDKAEPVRFRFPLAPAGASTVDVDFEVAPPLTDPSGSSKLYGAPIAAFGFTTD